MEVASGNTYLHNRATIKGMIALSRICDSEGGIDIAVDSSSGEVDLTTALTSIGKALQALDDSEGNFNENVISQSQIQDRSGYCDVHLESELVRYGTLLAGLYGGDQADCNPFEYWRCSHQDCHRCYDYRMYGYFNLDRQRGGRIQSDEPQQQERCGRHSELPFMVIGKFGEKRQFRCSFHGCDEVGSVVADFVAAVDGIREPMAQASSSKGEEKKAADELAVFGEFAIAAQLPVESAANAKPPMPDIRCTTNGKDHWFELGRITDTDLAKQTSGKWPDNPKPFSFLQEKPFLRIIEKKTEAKYETNGLPVDLILHFDQQPPDHEAMGRYLQKHADALDNLRRRGPFSRIWIYDGWAKSVIWCSQEF